MWGKQLTPTSIFCRHPNVTFGAANVKIVKADQCDGATPFHESNHAALMHQLHVLIAKSGVQWSREKKMHCTYFSVFCLLSSKSIIFQFLEVNAKWMMSMGAVSQGGLLSGSLNWIFPDQASLYFFFFFLPQPCKQRFVAYCLIQDYIHL